MAIIPQPSVFDWTDVDLASDLDRLRLVLDAIPDERLMRLLEAARSRGRDDYPVRATWNSVLAGVVYQHSSIESLRRELEAGFEARRQALEAQAHETERALLESVARQEQQLAADLQAEQARFADLRARLEADFAAQLEVRSAREREALLATLEAERRELESRLAAESEARSASTRAALQKEAEERERQRAAEFERELQSLRDKSAA